MGERTCTAPDCREPHRARGYCHKHWRRFRKTGSTADPKKPTAEQRFWAKVDAEGDCWEWLGARWHGYGRFTLGKDSGLSAIKVAAHRWAYEYLIGPIPDGLELDHLCMNPPCVNPDHLEPVPHIVNIERSRGRFRNLSKTQCPKGHLYSGENLIVHASGGRVCRECARDSWRRYRRRIRSRPAEHSDTQAVA